MAKNMICHICNDALAYFDYNGTQLLDEDGNKACFDCLLEAGAFDDEPEESVVCVEGQEGAKDGS
jgi:hypothetical protein